MAMISGPFTDEIVRMLQSSSSIAPAYGDLLLNSKKQYGVLGDGVVYISGETVREIPFAGFAAAGVRVVRCPEPYGDGFRLTEGQDTIWLPEWSPEERSFLKEICYQVFDGEATVAKIKSALGEKHHPLYALSCKTGVMAVDDVRKVAACLEKIR
ncbi:MAG TPA: hypothetical protein PKD52_05105 [Clostridiales bacterium]|nr:hypothetical protein [Clostridiales bacterium]